MLWLEPSTCNGWCHARSCVFVSPFASSHCNDRLSNFDTSHCLCAICQSVESSCIANSRRTSAWDGLCGLPIPMPMPVYSHPSLAFDVCQFMVGWRYILTTGLSQESHPPRSMCLMRHNCKQPSHAPFSLSPPHATSPPQLMFANLTWWQMSGRYSAGSFLCFLMYVAWSSLLSSTYAYSEGWRGSVQTLPEVRSCSPMLCPHVLMAVQYACMLKMGCSVPIPTLEFCLTAQQGLPCMLCQAPMHSPCPLAPPLAEHLQVQIQHPALWKSFPPPPLAPTGGATLRRGALFKVDFLEITKTAVRYNNHKAQS